MYYGTSIMDNELVYLNTIQEKTNLILDSEIFIQSLNESEDSKESSTNWFMKIVNFIKEKIMVVINAIKKAFAFVVEKITGKRKKNKEEENKNVEIIGVAKDEESAEKMAEDIKDIVSEEKSSGNDNNSEDETEDFEEKSSDNSSKENKELSDTAKKKIENAVKENLNNVNNDALQDFINSSKYKNYYSSKDGTSKYKPEIDRHQKVFAILKDPDASQEFGLYGRKTDVMNKLSYSIWDYRYNRYIRMDMIFDIQDAKSSNEKNDIISPEKIGNTKYEDVQKDFYSYMGKSENYDDFNSKYASIENVEKEKITVREIFDNGLFNEQTNSVDLPCNFEIKSVMVLIKNRISRLNYYYKELDKLSKQRNLDFMNKKYNQLMHQCITLNSKLMTEGIKCAYALSNGAIKALSAHESEVERISKWYKSKLKFVNITV